jgi:hypothetical protein
VGCARVWGGGGTAGHARVLGAERAALGDMALAACSRQLRLNPSTMLAQGAEEPRVLGCLVCVGWCVEVDGVGGWGGGVGMPLQVLWACTSCVGVIWLWLRAAAASGW